MQKSVCKKERRKKRFHELEQMINFFAISNPFCKRTFVVVDCFGIIGQLSCWLAVLTNLPILTLSAFVLSSGAVLSGRAALG